MASLPTPPGRAGRAGRLRAVVVVLALVAGSAASLTAAPASATTTTCTVSATLVDSCRPWLGAVADRYPNLATWRDQILGHEQRIGRRVDVVHQYHPVGLTSLSADERYFVDRGTTLYLNWKPATYWKDAGGGNAAVNGQIDAMAASVKAVAPHKLMLALWGEPERFVTVGTSSCPDLKGNLGSPAQYRQMWQNVRSRFDAAGVTNVVWVMNYLGYVRWDCLFPELWPGNALVDWVVWDPYVGPYERWDDIVGYFYGALGAKSDTTHAFTSKPWGLAEFGYWYGTRQYEAYRMYDEAKASLDGGRFPRLKLYEPFDTISGTGVDTRIGYTSSGVADPTEQSHYNALAADPAFSVGTSSTAVDYFATCDKSVETGLSCFSGSYRAPVSPSWSAAGGYEGTHSVLVTNTTTGSGDYGLNARPVPVASTVAGTTYRGGAWVRAGGTGTVLTLLLRERRPADGTAPVNGFTAVTWTATDTLWHRLAASYTAKENGNTVTFSVYGARLAPGASFRADVFALTSG
jgi:hypothetical protein